MLDSPAPTVRDAQLILVADDNDADRALLCRRLQRWGFSTMAAADGAAAVEMTLAWRPDLVLMDLSMPDVDGIEAWRIITEMTSSPPPAIALSAVMLSDLRITCAEAGFLAYFSKPVDLDVLRSEITRACSRQRVA